MDINLFNAAVVGENPDAAFFVEGEHLHAADARVVSLKKEKSKPELTLPLLRNALKALIKFAEGKVENHFLEVDWKGIAGKDEQPALISKIDHIYSHLPHQERKQLSSLIHHSKSMS